MIQLYPPATDTTLGLLDRWCIEITGETPWIVPCLDESFAKGALTVLRSLPPEVLSTLAPKAPILVAATPEGVESTEIPETPPTPPEPVVEAPRPQSVISTSEVENPRQRRGLRHDRLPADAPQTWSGFKDLGDRAAEDLLIDLLRRGYTEGGLSKLYGLSQGAVTSRRAQIRDRLHRKRDLDTPSVPVAASGHPLPAPETPKTTPSTPVTTTRDLGAMLDAEIPPLERTPGTALYELGRRGMAFIPACQALSLEPSKALHLEWKEGQYDRACEER